MSETRLVRLKPYDPGEGNVLKSYSVNVRGPDPARFIEGKWFEVSTKMADYLLTVREKPGSKGSPLAFDICMNKREAKELVRRERMMKERIKAPDDPSEKSRNLSTDDIPKRSYVDPNEPDPAPPITDDELGKAAEDNEDEPEDAPPTPPAKPEKKPAKKKPAKKKAAKRKR